MLAYGIDPKVIMAELTGRGAGISAARAARCTCSRPSHKFYGGHGIVGAQVCWARAWPSAISQRRRRVHGPIRRRRGQPGPGLRNLQHGALWKLPIVFVVENNQYAMGTAVSAARPNAFLSRGTAFRIPGMPVNGMDVLEVRQAAEVALEYVRAGNGPVLMELNTYRYRGHSMSDPAKYRSREEVQEMREKHDPIEAPSRNCSRRDRGRDQGHRQEDSPAGGPGRRLCRKLAEPDMAELYTDVLVETY
jgi:pyruvate dehydrogenase E1 component alpha subunit